MSIVKKINEVIDLYNNSSAYIQAEVEIDLNTIYEKINEAARLGKNRATIERTFFQHISVRYEKVNGLTYIMNNLKDNGFNVIIADYQIVITGWAV